MVWKKKLKKNDLIGLDRAIREWSELPEAQGFGNVTAAYASPPWAHGPRVTVELSSVTDGEYDRLLFYFRKKMVGYRVVGVWTVKPRERIWPIEDPTTEPVSEVAS